MNKNDLIRGGTLFKPLLVLVLSMVLLLSGAVLPAREAKAAPVTPTREVDLSAGNVTVHEKEVVRIYQNSGTTTGNGIIVDTNSKATIILDRVNHSASKAFLFLREGADVTLLLKGETRVKTQGDNAGIAMWDRTNLLIKDYGNGDGIFNEELTANSVSYPVIGANNGGAASLTIKSGKLVLTSRGGGAGIGADANSTLNLTIDDPAIVEAHSLGEGPAIGTKGYPTGSSTVNATINGGTITADNKSDVIDGGKMRTGAVIGVGSRGPGTGNMTLNIPKTSTAKLYLTSYYGGAAIGGSGFAALTSPSLASVGGNRRSQPTLTAEPSTLRSKARRLALAQGLV